jgi:hypothetical protein
MKGEWGGGRGLAALSSSPIAPLMHIGFRQGIVAPYTQAALDLGDPAVGYRRARLVIAGAVGSPEKPDRHELRCGLLLHLAIHPAGQPLATA